ncbi:hypothetical protein [Nocardia terpenica]|uniref:PE domain-containing protein n=1 Tax=Nocardia terpenica TaxID=455432 RepID=A0A164NRQ8_9NOCA|nr:hypothetical protein [Nocardia terpenica]KZM74651.1 hypothetical protein AWN90_21510 [Nocardia terpenica]NQE93750.1 hypothetical protein [Nocardia terpenica]QIS21657.1 hypothetical protein F6W96_28290 [Nocardia terpenica]
MIAGADPAEWQRLLGQANSGHLSLDPEIGKGLDQVCDDYLNRLNGIMKSADRLRVLGGFGTFQSGKDLEKKFREKATGSDQSLNAILQQHMDVVKTAKEVVAKAIANFVEQDRQNSDRISRAGGTQ